MKLWKKEYQLNQQIENYTVGNDFLIDLKLIKYDCLGSIAHARMLHKIGLLTDKESSRLVQSLETIIKLDENGQFKIRREQEDCHTAIENYLVENLGDLGKKIHTARSRNDQVLTALRLYYKEQLQEITLQINQFCQACQNLIEKYPHIQLPGFTHTRKAMPSSLELWTNAWIEAMQDNLKLLNCSLDLIDQSPLGTAAGYGIPIDIDRPLTAKTLGFNRVQQNPIYTQLSRGKFEATLIHLLSQIMFDFNRIASDLILFSMHEFGYFELPPEFCTGSSIMPQKKNPDVLELVRAKYHQVLSSELQIKSMSANLISGYHRDMQLSKEPTLKSLETTLETIRIMTLIFKQLKVNQKNCQKGLTQELYATQKVYQLVQKGMPFRDAYQQVAKDY